MKKSFIYPCALLLTAALLCPVVYATDNPVAEEIHSAVAYGTPTIDGSADECYLQSQRIDYKLQPWYCHEDSRFAEEQVKEKYGWDTGVEAYSYMVWDESNIYFYISVKDDTSGIIDFDMVETDSENAYAITYQDGISLSLLTGDASERANIYVERGGRFAGTTLNDGFTTLKELKYKVDDRTDLNNGYYAVVENDDGYSVELKIPVTEEVSERYLKMASSIDCRLTVHNYSDTLPYGYWSFDPSGKTEPGFDGGVWYNEIIYETKFNSDTASVICRYADLVGTDSGDVNGDGAVDVRDIVRLMKNIASDITPEPVFDVSLDGELDSRDLVALMKKISLG